MKNQKCLRKAMLFDKLFGRLFIKPFPAKKFSDSERRENDEGLEFSAIGKTEIIHYTARDPKGSSVFPNFYE